MTRIKRVRTVAKYIVQPHFSCGKGVIRSVDKSKD